MHSKSEIDFTPLSGFRRGYIASSGSLYLILIVTISIFAYGIVLALSVLFQSSGVLLIGSAAYLVFAIKLIRDNMSHRRKNEEYLRAFATINHLSYQPELPPAGVGTLFSIGDSQEETNVLSGMLDELPFRLYDYKYETGSGKSRTTHNHLIMELTLPRVVPQFVIDSSIEEVLPINFDKSQKIELEGDFHKYFDLYAPDKYGVSALTILAPDTMEVIMQHAALCDIEIIQNKMYFYWPTLAKNQQQYEKVFVTTQSVVAKIGEKLTAADIYATKAQAQIYAQPNAQGARLKKSKWTVIVSVAIIFSVFMLQFAEYAPNKPFKSAAYGAYIVFIMAMSGWAIIRVSKRHRLKKEYLKRYKV